MPARAAVHELIENDLELESLGVEAVYGSNSIDTPAEKLFVVIRWDATPVAFKSTGADRCSIWAHDKNRDYTRIDKVLQRIKDLLTEAVHHEGGDGWTMTLASWNGEGPDLVDGGFHTVTRYADFTVVSRYTTT